MKCNNPVGGGGRQASGELLRVQQRTDRDVHCDAEERRERGGVGGGAEP